MNTQNKWLGPERRVPPPESHDTVIWTVLGIVTTVMIVVVFVFGLPL